MVGTLAFKPRVDGFESRFAHSNQLLQSNIAIQQNGNLLWSLRPAPFWRTVYPRGSLAPLCALLILATVLPTEWCTICCGPSLTRRHFVRGRDIPSCSSDHVFTFCWIALLECNSWLECAKRDSNPSTLGLKANVPTIKPSAPVNGFESRLTHSNKT